MKKVGLMVAWWAEKMVVWKAEKMVEWLADNLAAKLVGLTVA